MRGPKETSLHYEETIAIFDGAHSNSTSLCRYRDYHFKTLLGVGNSFWNGHQGYDYGFDDNGSKIVVSPFRPRRRGAPSFEEA